MRPPVGAGLASGADAGASGSYARPRPFRSLRWHRSWATLPKYRILLEEWTRGRVVAALA